MNSHHLTFHLTERLLELNGTFSLSFQEHFITGFYRYLLDGTFTVAISYIFAGHPAPLPLCMELSIT